MFLYADRNYINNNERRIKWFFTGCHDILTDYFGILVGVVVALAAAFILKKVNFATDGFDTIFVFSMALVSYAGASMINGNGYLAAYIAGIILGNTPLHHKNHWCISLMESPD